jgi:hypothetical protein
MLNVVQLVLIFAIFYRSERPDLEVKDALVTAVLVFGTVSRPDDAKAIAGCQIAIDFMLLAVFLAHFVGRLGSEEAKARPDETGGPTNS